MSKLISSTADLARHLGISRWAVSRAINGQGGVSAETVADVRRAMERFGFTPSPHGRALSGRRTGVIGICFRALDTPITIEKIASVQRLVGEHGYRPLFELTGVTPSGGLDVINHFVSMRVEAVLLVDSPPAAECLPWVRLLRRNRIPSAFLEPRGEAKDNAVYLDREGALRRITEHLLLLGHSRIALLGISARFPLGAPRLRGVKSALRAHGLDPEKSLTLFDIPEHRYQGLPYGNELAEAVLAARQRPTAFIALNDEIAAGAMWRLQRDGWKFPGEASMFGFDNLPLSAQTLPALSTVDHRVEVAAAAAANLLFRLIELGPAERLPLVRIEPELILRDSAAAPT